jgi:hypothetical protein
MSPISGLAAVKLGRYFFRHRKCSFIHTARLYGRSQIENTLLVRPDVQNARKEQIPAIRMGKTLTPILVITAVFGRISIHLCPTASHRLYPCSLIPSSHHSESISIFTAVASGDMDTAGYTGSTQAAYIIESNFSAKVTRPWRGEMFHRAAMQ